VAQVQMGLVGVWLGLQPFPWSHLVLSSLVPVFVQDSPAGLADLDAPVLAHCHCFIRMEVWGVGCSYRFRKTCIF